MKSRARGLSVAPDPVDDSGGSMRLERANLSESVYRRIRTAIMSGRFSPGERLRIATLAEQFGVSITPVREAIFRLVSEGALVMRAATAVSVPVLTAQQLREIQLTRILLEGACAERAALLVDGATITELDTIHREYIRAWQRDPVEASELNRQFHFVLAAAGDMPIVFSVIEKMWAMMGPILHTFHVAMKPRRLGVESHRHHQVVQALRRRDGVAAREAIQADIHWSDAIIAWAEQRAVHAKNGSGPA